MIRKNLILDLKARFVAFEDVSFVDRSTGEKKSRVYCHVVKDSALERFSFQKGVEIPDLEEGREYTFHLSMFTIKGARYLSICGVDDECKHGE